MSGWYQRGDGTWGKVVESNRQPAPTPLVNWYQRPDGSWDPVRVQTGRPTSPPIVTHFDANGTIQVISGMSGLANKIGAAVTLAAAGTIPVVSGQVGAATRTLLTKPAAGSILVTTTVSGNATQVVHIFAASGTVVAVSGQSGNPVRTPVVRAAVGTITLNTLLSGNPGVPVGSLTFLMGCSASVNDHGGTEDWDGWRCYTKSKRDSLMNRTGSTRPIFVAYSEQGAPFSGTYATIRQHVLDDLNARYYVGGATSQTHSAAWGIRLYWSNGNENSDKGMLATNNASNLALWMTSQQALYDAVHYIDPVTGQRRFPHVYAGSNPTQNHELSGIVQWWLHPSAKWHDFVMWSMYPPGRNNAGGDDPIFNYPSFSEANRNNRDLGFLLRCFYRTNLARAQARIDLGDPNFDLTINCGEIAIGADPDDSTTRGYYAAHGLAGGAYLLGIQYNINIDYMCWWDNDVGDGHSILSDEPTSTNPSTRVVWQNWQSYDHRRGGVHPSQWAGNPKPGWLTTGTPV